MTNARAATIEAARALAPELASASGSVIRQWFRKPLPVEDKSDASPVTIADRDAEAALRQLIGQHFPDHGIHGEEHGIERPDADFVWILDPIDGTRGFICGVPLFGTLIALTYQGEPVLGVLDQPISGERWIGVEGEPTRFNGAPISVRRCASTAAAACFTTDPNIFLPGDEKDRFERVRAEVKLMRYGADCYAYGLVALGQADAVIESCLKPYDYAALVPIVRGAGGIFTGWRGERPQDSPNGRVLVAGDRRVHEGLLELIA